jgi:hypothetical protein
MELLIYVILIDKMKENKMNKKLTYEIVTIGSEGTREGTIAHGLSYRDAMRQAPLVAGSVAWRRNTNAFVTWYRESDGQRGYLNQDGSHAIIGRAWQPTVTITRRNRSLGHGWTVVCDNGLIGEHLGAAAYAYLYGNK